MSADVRLGLGIVLLIGMACAVLTAAQVAQRRAVVLASLRAVLQLAFVALVLRGVFMAPAAVVAVLVVMFTVATGTAARRLREQAGALRAAAVGGALGAAPVIALIVGLPVLSRDVRTLVAVSGIVLGGTMTASTLTGRRLFNALDRRRDEVEAWLSIGATPRQAVRPLAREATFEALVPALDQTRTVGLVTLPGAFVGALLGGASASEAARFQIVVLVGLLAAQAITSVVVARILGAPTTLPPAVAR